MAEQKKSIEQSLAVFKRGCDDILIESDLIERLESKETLTIKFGCDPTAPDIHLGHTVIFNKLRQLQDLGHTVQFVIGGFTAQIGDPSGKNTTRPPLTPEEVKHNAETYKHQVFKILDPQRTQVVDNSDWFDQMNAADMITLAAKSTVARMLERDDFHKRYQAHQAIAIHEFLYPLVQGYDSVALASDIEIGGTDQRFNLLMGRELQKEAGQTPQIVLTMPLLEGTDGVKKMSKSANNYIGIEESPDAMFGKIMSISDQLMWRYYELLSFESMHKIQQRQIDVKEHGANPRDMKVDLAKEIVARFYDQASAQQAYEHFTMRFQKKQLPDDLPEKTVLCDQATLGIATLLKQAELVKSTSEAMRLIKQGAVKVDGQKVEDKNQVFDCQTSHVLQVGKRRFARVIIEQSRTHEKDQ